MIGPQSRKDLFKIRGVVDTIRGSKMLKHSSQKSLESAEILALKGLDFLAQEPDRLGRFVALTGIGPDQLRSEAGTPIVLAAVLEHLLADESSLLVFCSLNEVAPEEIAPAQRTLAAASAQSDPDEPPDAVA